MEPGLLLLLQYLDEIGARLTKGGQNMPHLLATVREQIAELHDMVRSLWSGLQ